MEPKSKPCVFLGYSKNQSAYLCLEPNSNKIYVSRHVLFDESNFPFANFSRVTNKESSNENSFIVDFPVTSTVPSLQESSTSLPLSATAENSSTSEVASHTQDSSSTSEKVLSIEPFISSLPSLHVNITPAARTHPMVTRSQNNIFKPKVLNTVTKHPLPETVEPTNAAQAIKKVEWKAAMLEELEALHRNKDMGN
ncbi:hypothetical protein CCACVL1_01028 [Corchorus capsularis]|uniref:Retroviral polymerase SH3-like domain-containing protein n=1 Tax=Corchorus capsularis TaxID=210143 RepID=A0A1R3KS21_COCAP|nr:hypothetical protein CCACVL1_01028 [Corchorus capsularis]